MNRFEDAMIQLCALMYVRDEDFYVTRHEAVDEVFGAFVSNQRPEAVIKKTIVRVMKLAFGGDVTMLRRGEAVFKVRRIYFLQEAQHVVPADSPPLHEDSVRRDFLTGSILAFRRYVPNTDGIVPQNLIGADQVYVSVVGRIHYHLGILLRGTDRCDVVERTPETGKVCVRSLTEVLNSPHRTPARNLFVKNSLWNKGVDILALLYRLSRILGKAVDADSDTVVNFLRAGEVERKSFTQDDDFFLMERRRKRGRGDLTRQVLRKIGELLPSEE